MFEVEHNFSCISAPLNRMWRHLYINDKWKLLSPILPFAFCTNYSCWQYGHWQKKGEGEKRDGEKTKIILSYRIWIINDFKIESNDCECWILSFVSIYFNARTIALRLNCHNALPVAHTVNGANCSWTARFSKVAPRQHQWIDLSKQYTDTWPPTYV